MSAFGEKRSVKVITLNNLINLLCIRNTSKLFNKIQMMTSATKINQNKLNSEPNILLAIGEKRKKSTPFSNLGMTNMGIKPLNRVIIVKIVLLTHHNA